jgi:23S rRNA pseudoU1915 N3-methylase RlmH
MFWTKNVSIYTVNQNQNKKKQNKNQNKNKQTKKTKKNAQKKKHKKVLGEDGQPATCYFMLKSLHSMRSHINLRVSLSISETELISTVSS